MEKTLIKMAKKERYNLDEDEDMAKTPFLAK